MNVRIERSFLRNYYKTLQITLGNSLHSYAKSLILTESFRKPQKNAGNLEENMFEKNKSQGEIDDQSGNIHHRGYKWGGTGGRVCSQSL